MPESRKRNLDVEPERYELREAPRYRFDLDRRTLFGAAGAGLLISASRSAASAQRARGEGGPSLAARLHIAGDGRITVMTSKVEIGQGSRAQLTQAAAEELRVPAGQVSLLMADTELTPDDGSTAGSRTTPANVPEMRRAAAAAREILVDLARQHWKAGDAPLEAADGAVVDPASGKRLPYGELAQKAELGEALKAATAPARIALTPVEKWRVLGSSVPRPNGRDLVTGAHRFPSDIARPNMLYGAVLRPPSYGAVLEKVDLAAADELPGVTAVRDGDFVGCAAATSYDARKAAEALAAAASWKRVPHPPSTELFEYLEQNVSTSREPRVRTEGSIEDGLRTARRTFEADFHAAYIQHAPMEPRAAVAEWEDGKLTVWTGTQRPDGVREELQAAFRLGEGRVRVIVPDTGGGFGGKHTGDAAVEAARLAKAAKRPVSLRWTREEEFTWAYFRPAGLIRIKAGVDGQGGLTAWDFTNFNSGASAMASPYTVAHRREQFLYCDSPLREGSYRVLAATANVFARESFMDELAQAAGADPLDYRLGQLDDERMRAVLEAAAKRFRWRDRKGKSKPGRGVGLACGTEKGSYAAACVEVEADTASGSIRVLEVCQAFECGAIQNPANLQAQVEGCVIMTLGAALTEEIRFEDGRILNARFSEYSVPRFKDVPKLETVLLDRPGIPSVGGSETPMIAAPPAVANAVADAASVRLRSLPLRLPTQRA